MYIDECQGKIKSQEKESAESPASMEVEIEAFRQLADKITVEMNQELSKIRYKILQDRLEREWETLNKESERKKASARCIQNSIGDLYDQVREELLTKIDQLERKGTQSWDMPLPQITIPHFFGRYEEWNTFSDLFQKMIHANNNLSNAQKMQHLKAYVRGEASKLIQPLCIAENNYETAWNLLKNRYYNKRLLITKLLDNLLDMPEVRDGSAKELKELHDTTNECLQAITNMGVLTETWGPMMTRIVTRKWDQETRRAYEQSLKNSHEIENFTEMMNFLQQRFQSLEACSHGNRRNGGQLQMAPSKKEECKFCNEQHWIQYCQKFKNLTAFEKNQVVREKNICRQCLSHYNDKRCNNTRSCQICRRQHHTMLHLEQQKPANSNRAIENRQDKSKSSTVLSHLGRHDKSILITTALVNAVTIFGTQEILRVLVDPGSQASFITEQAAQLVGKPKQKIYAEVSGLGDAAPKISNYKINLKLTPRFSSGFAMNVNLLVLPKLTESLPQNSIETDLQEWRNYMLADPTFNKSGPIDIILGAKEYGEILVNGLYKSTKGLVAQNTELGWILSGPMTGNSINTVRIQSMITRTEEDQQPTKCGELKEISGPRKVTEAEEICEELKEISVPRKLTEAEEACEEHFEKTVQRKEDGTYVVQMPFKEETTFLGDSRNRTMARLMQLEKNFTKNEKLKIAYNQFMQEYIDLGHMIKILFNADNEGKYYIPHQPVVREESTTFVDAQKHFNQEVRLIEIEQEVQDDLVTNGTQWQCIPPSTPQFGSLWEAGVTSIIHHMKRIINNVTLTPLTVLTDNTDDIQALTPGHILIWREWMTSPDPIGTPINSSISSRWRLVERIKKEWWKASSSKDSSRLQQRHNWKTQKRNAQIGERVLIKEDIKPSRSPLARETEVHPGKDGAVREISRRNADGTTVEKAIHKTIPLPVNSEVTVDTENNTTQRVNASNATTRISSRRYNCGTRTFWSFFVFYLVATTTTANYTIHYPPPGMYVEQIIGLSEEFGRIKKSQQFLQDNLNKTAWKKIGHHTILTNCVSGTIILGILGIAWLTRWLIRRCKKQKQREAHESEARRIDQEMVELRGI